MTRSDHLIIAVGLASIILFAAALSLKVQLAYSQEQQQQMLIVPDDPITETNETLDTPSRPLLMIEEFEDGSVRVYTKGDKTPIAGYDNIESLLSFTGFATVLDQIPLCNLTK